jgi:hypothetical protein
MGVAGSPSRIIVVGNEKGGSGKTTVAMHVAIGLLRLGFSVGTVDIDTHQRSLTRYLDNRRMWCEDHDRSLPIPRHCLIGASGHDSASAALAEERLSLTDAIEQMGDRDFLVLDCPAGDGLLSRFAHSLADTLITPLNDSFVDVSICCCSFARAAFRCWIWAIISRCCGTFEISAASPGNRPSTGSSSAIVCPVCPIKTREIWYGFSKEWRPL